MAHHTRRALLTRPWYRAASVQMINSRDPLLLGLEPLACSGLVGLSAEEQLWTLAKPHLLRRTKEHLQAESSEAILGKRGGLAAQPSLEVIGRKETDWLRRAK